MSELKHLFSPQFIAAWNGAVMRKTSEPITENLCDGCEASIATGASYKWNIRHMDCELCADCDEEHRGKS